MWDCRSLFRAESEWMGGQSYQGVYGRRDNEGSKSWRTMAGMRMEDHTRNVRSCRGGATCCVRSSLILSLRRRESITEQDYYEHLGPRDPFSNCTNPCIDKIDVLAVVQRPDMDNGSSKLCGDCFRHSGVSMISRTRIARRVVFSEQQQFSEDHHI